MVIALARHLRRSRRRPLTWLVVGCLALGVVGAHSALAHDHMGKAAAVCLAVIDAAILGIGAALASRGRGPSPGRQPLVVAAPLSFASPAPEPSSRAGPDLLQVFRH